MRLMLINHGLGPGGAERVVSCLGNAWSRRGWQVEIVTLDDGQAAFPLEAEIVRRPLAVAGPSPTRLARIRNVAARVRALRAAIRQSRPDVAVSFQTATNIIAILATRGLWIPVVVSERSDPLATSLAGQASSRLFNWAYRRAAAIVMQSQRAAECLDPRLARRVAVIPNPVAIDEGADIGGETTLPRPVVLAVGRLTREKGYDLLLQAWARLDQRFGNWSLAIAGDGTEKSELESLCRRLGLYNRVWFLGKHPAPQQLMRQADLFVLSSRFEGFPNVLCEAMACGLAAVAFDCRLGPREIVTHRVDGLLVPPEDVDRLAATLEQAMGDEALRRRLGQNAARIVERLDLSRILAAWDEVLARATAKKRA